MNPDQLFSFISRFFRYLLNKRSELDKLNFNDVLLTKVILDIHRTKKSSRFESVNLYSLEPLHPIDRETAIAAMLERVKAVNANKELFVRRKLIDRELLAKYLPSISWIKAVSFGAGRYVSFEGNGRLEALRRVVGKNNGIEVEVEVYYCKNTAKTIRRINRVRRHNGLKAIA